MITRLPICLVMGLLTGCTFDPEAIGKQPPLTPVGAGLKQDAVAIRTEPSPRPVYRRGNSIWQDSTAAMFQDPRATRIGDIVTVKISIKDKAQLENESNRSRQSNADLDANFAYSLSLPNLTTSGSGSLTPAVTANTATDGKGEIDRSEKIELKLAAVVTGVLPNGNLMINGSQEVLVNYEARVLRVAGIVRPGDISTDNIVPYDKMAEARISYGGRGRIMEVQQPGWGQQIVDALAPY